MKVNIPLEIDDDQRNQIACLLRGKPVKALATRSEIRDLASALINDLIDLAGTGVLEPIDIIDSVPPFTSTMEETFTQPTPEQIKKAEMYRKIGYQQGKLQDDGSLVMTKSYNGSRIAQMIDLRGNTTQTRTLRRE